MAWTESVRLAGLRAVKRLKYINFYSISLYQTNYEIKIKCFNNANEIKQNLQNSEKKKKKKNHIKSE